VSTPASAREVRAPESGYPAITFELPDGWTIETGAKGEFSVRPAGRKQELIGFDIIEGTVPPGGNLVMHMNDKPIRGTPATVGGLRAFKFVDVHSPFPDVTNTLATTAIVVDDRHIAVCNMLLTSQTPIDIKAQAEAIVASIKVVAAPREGQ
jgi:hypothetical protein